jgi:hypothetical protein
MTTLVRDRAPDAVVVPERTKRRPVMLVSLDIGFDDAAVAMAISAAADTGAELLICLGVTLPVANANAAARRTMGNPVVREQIAEIMKEARVAGVKAHHLVYNTPRPLAATIGVAKTREVGLLVFGPDRKRYGRLRFRLHARALRRKAGCLVWPLE